jgi:glycosyltransferase involved in cell wall biosynthesis
MREADSVLVQAQSSVQHLKVLVVVDRFPATGGSRIDKFVRLLPNFGVEPLVLSAKETDSPEAEELRKRIYPPELKTYQAGSLGWTHFAERFLVRGPGAKHYRLLGLLSFPERAILVPDYMVRWIPLGMRLAAEIIKREGIRVVLTSSPSESVHLIGLRLKRKLGIRWVADFRDLWTEKKLLYRPATPLHDWFIRRLERKVFQTADHIIANTPENADRFTVIPNGFDRDDLAQQPASETPPQVFRIGYAGSLDKHDFPWRIALQAVRRLAVEKGRDKVRFVHCGYLSEQVKTYFRDEKIEDLVEAHGNLPHDEAMRITSDTAVKLVLLYENAYSTSIVPLKLYNYLIMKGPMLAIAPEEGRTAAIIAETRTGVVVSAKRGVDAVYKQLHGFYEAWQRGELTVDPNLEEIARYDSHTQTRMLAEILRGH